MHLQSNYTIPNLGNVWHRWKVTSTKQWVRWKICWPQNSKSLLIALSVNFKACDFYCFQLSPLLIVIQLIIKIDGTKPDATLLKDIEDSGQEDLKFTLRITTEGKWHNSSVIYVIVIHCWLSLNDECKLWQ